MHHEDAGINTMNTRDKSDLASSVFLVGLTLVVLYVMYLILRPLLNTLLLAAFLAVLANPLYRKILALFKGRKVPSALLSCFIIIILILIPLGGLLSMLTVESITLYGRVADFVQGGGIQKVMDSQAAKTIGSLFEKYFSAAEGQQFDITAKLIEMVQSTSRYFIGLGQKLAANFATAAALFFILIFTLFFLFIDGERVIAYMVEISPLTEARSKRLLNRFEDVTYAAFLGSFGVAAAQGTLGGIALAIVGYQGIFWGLMMALCSLIPMVGSAIIWVPSGIILLIGGRWIAGIFILAWGVAIVSTVDNFLRPYLMHGRSGLHPVIILLSVLGGIQQFGVLGIVFGPLVAAVGLSLLDMFKEEFGSSDRAAAG